STWYINGDDNRIIKQGISDLLGMFFFFRAEDGIRDFHVTGVQTCALPIWHRYRLLENRGSSISSMHCNVRLPCRQPLSSDPASRSEERRVGKESRTSKDTNH